MICLSISKKSLLQIDDDVIVPFLDIFVRDGFIGPLTKWERKLQLLDELLGSDWCRAEDVLERVASLSTKL
jgi:hypothetical protein